MTFNHAGRPYTLTRRDGKDDGPGAWYMRRGNSRFSLATTDRAEAIARAREELRQRAAGRDTYAAHRAAHRQRGGRTVASLAQMWSAQNYSQPNGTPRTEEARARLAPILARALRWWASRTADTITPPDLLAYAQARRAAVRAGSNGGRTVDMELQSLSNLFQWALFAGHVNGNPFASRPTFADPAAVSHSSERAPDNDEQLHALCAHIWSAGHPVAAAQLMFQALTGLRPGEPAALRFDAHATRDGGTPGWIYTRTVDGITIPTLAIAREKGGTNPAVRVHPVLRAFLDWWLPTVAKIKCGPQFWFPGDGDGPLHPPGAETHALSGPLRAACAALGTHRITPHAMRAYYVTVRRSAGVDDATIGHELGENTGPKLIARTYGSPSAVIGNGLHDWLPADAAPWWQQAQT